MKIALILTAGLWAFAAQAASEMHQTENECPDAVLMDAYKLRKFQEEIDMMVIMIPSQLLDVAPEKQRETGERLLNTYKSHYFQRLRAFRNQHGDVNCVARARGIQVTVTFKEAYEKLDAYEREMPKLQACEPAFAHDFHEASREAEGTLTAMQQLSERLQNVNGAPSEKDKRDYRQVLEVFRDQTKRFRAKHPEPFRCQLTKETVADYEGFDGYLLVVEGEIERMK